MRPLKRGYQPNLPVPEHLPATYDPLPERPLLRQVQTLGGDKQAFSSKQRRFTNDSALDRATVQCRIRFRLRQADGF